MCDLDTRVGGGRVEAEPHGWGRRQTRERQEGERTIATGLSEPEGKAETSK